MSRKVFWGFCLRKTNNEFIDVLGTKKAFLLIEWKVFEWSLMLKIADEIYSFIDSKDPRSL